MTVDTSRLRRYLDDNAKPSKSELLAALDELDSLRASLATAAHRLATITERQRCLKKVEEYDHRGASLESLKDAIRNGEP